MDIAMHAYVVESPVTDSRGKVATARVYVATEERAREIASAHPERTWRMIQLNDMPLAAKENLIRSKSSS